MVKKRLNEVGEQQHMVGDECPGHCSNSQLGVTGDFHCAHSWAGAQLSGPHLHAQLASTSVQDKTHTARLPWPGHSGNFFGSCWISLNSPWGYRTRCMRTRGDVSLKVGASCYEWIWWTCLHGCGLNDWGLKEMVFCLFVFEEPFPAVL